MELGNRQLPVCQLLDDATTRGFTEGAVHHAERVSHNSNA
jgi:hypothetical protein